MISNDSAGIAYINDKTILKPTIIIILLSCIFKKSDNSGENKNEGDVVYQNINKVLAIPGVSTHIYGKKKSRLNRKMGHITVVNKQINEAIKIGKQIKELVKVTV